MDNISFLTSPKNYIFSKHNIDHWNHYINLHAEYGIIFENDIAHLNHILSSLKIYNINKNIPISDTVEFILTNLNTLTHDKYNDITIIKPGARRGVFKYKNSVFKIDKIGSIDKIGNSNNIRLSHNSFQSCICYIFENFFNMLAYNFVINNNFQNEIIVPKCINYGIIECNDKRYFFYETEFIEDYFIKNNILNCTLDKQTQFLIEYTQKYKKAVSLFNDKLPLFFIDEYRPTQYIFNTNIIDEIDKYGTNVVFDKIRYIRPACANKVLPNIYYSTTNKIVFVDFDLVSRSFFTKYAYRKSQIMLINKINTRQLYIEQHKLYETETKDILNNFKKYYKINKEDNTVNSIFDNNSKSIFSQLSSTFNDHGVIQLAYKASVNIENMYNQYNLIYIYDFFKKYIQEDTATEYFFNTLIIFNNKDNGDSVQKHKDCTLDRPPYKVCVLYVYYPDDAQGGELNMYDNHDNKHMTIFPEKGKLVKFSGALSHSVTNFFSESNDFRFSLVWELYD